MPSGGYHVNYDMLLLAFSANSAAAAEIPGSQWLVVKDAVVVLKLVLPVQMELESD